MKILTGLNILTMLMVNMFLGGPTYVAEQSMSSDSCPTITVNCAYQDCGCGPIYEFVATVTGGDPEVRPSYHWSVTPGKIEDGEGTSRIIVNASESTGKALTATVVVRGYDKACSTTASISHVCCRSPTPEKP